MTAIRQLSHNKQLLLEDFSAQGDRLFYLVYKSTNVRIEPTRVAC